jgi:hypothetical protein
MQSDNEIERSVVGVPIENNWNTSDEENVYGWICNFSIVSRENHGKKIDGNSPTGHIKIYV